MGVFALNAKQVQKRGTTALEVPTIPASNDHTDGSWLDTDVYSGEFYLNETDVKLYMRVSGAIKQVAWTTDIPPASNTIYSADDTIGAGRVATLTDTVTFDGGTTIAKGSSLLAANANFKAVNSSNQVAIESRDDTHVGFGGVPSTTYRVNISNVATKAGAVNISALSMGANGNAILISATSTSGECRGVFSNATASGGGIARALYGNSESTASGTNIGVYARARNASTLVQGLYALVPGGDTVNPSSYTAALDGDNASAMSTDKRAISVRIQNDVANGTTYLLKASDASGGANSNRFGGHIVLSKADATITKTAMHLEATGTGTNYALVTNGGLSGFGTVTPTALVHVKDGQFFIEQVTDTVAANAFTVDWDQGNHTEIDMQPATGAVTATLSNPKSGAWYTIKIIQGSGLHNITWPAAVKWPGGTAPTITATDNAVDLIELYYDGTNYLASFKQDIK